MATVTPPPISMPQGLLKGVPWSHEEHAAFLLGLEKLGKGNWRGISRTFVPTRTPTQVASHAQKYFLRAANGGSKRKSRFCGVTAAYATGQPAAKVQRTSAHKDASCPGDKSDQDQAPAPSPQEQQQQQQQQQRRSYRSQQQPTQAFLDASDPGHAAISSATHPCPGAPCPPAATQGSAAKAVGLPVAPLSLHGTNPTSSAMPQAYGVPALHPRAPQPQDALPAPASLAGATVYGVPCFPLPHSSMAMMGCMVPPGMLQPLAAHGLPHHHPVLPAYLTQLLQQHLQEQQPKQQRQPSGELPFGPLHTLALASSSLAEAGSSEAVVDASTQPEPCKLASSSPSASNASLDSICSNRSSHDSTLLTAALKAGLCRPAPVRGSPAQTSSLLAALQPSSSLSSASSGTLAAMDLHGQQPEPELQLRHVPSLRRPSAFKTIVPSPTC